ncbi:hypothetical protein ACTFIY_004850 [Dictyostelium cf. discoideum]
MLKCIQRKISACTANNGTFKMCGYDLPLFYFPSPLLISEFKPKTRGGNTTLSGYYLELKERIFVQYENYYLKDQFLCSNNVYLISGVFQSKTPDRINLILQPNIEKIDINQSILDITNPFSSKLNVQVGCCDYWSNKFQITYPPIPSSSNSIPKLKGGLLIINGNRLTSSPSSSNNNISVTVGDSICSVVSSSPNEIKCNLQPLSNSTFNNSSLITVSIITFSQVNDEIHIIGGCFGNISSTQIHINGKQVSGQIKSINNDETILILKVQNQIYNFNISIESNSIKSNGINVDVKMYARINEIPLVGNKLINFTLFHVNSSNINLIPTIKILNEQSNQTSKSISTNVNENVVSCSFLIENNCGIIKYEIEISNLRYQSSFSYESPSINKCNLNSNEIVTCIGKGFINKYNETSIISNQSLSLNNEINNSSDKSISFQMNDDYNILGELYLNVCEKECKLNYSRTSLECNIKLNGPNDKTLSTFNIIYKSPSINQTTIINLKQGGILTIIGNDFYYPIDKVTIIGSGSDYINCNEPKYINDTMITCFIQATKYTFNNIKNVFKYLTQSDDVGQYSGARNIFQNLLSILIIIIISLLFISNI